jgi:hypothetical protein
MTNAIRQAVQQVESEQWAAISERARQIVRECEFELVTNFDLPAISIISHHAARLGMDRETFEVIREAIEQEKQ